MTATTASESASAERADGMTSVGESLLKELEEKKRPIKQLEEPLNEF